MDTDPTFWGYWLNYPWLPYWVPWHKNSLHRTASLINVIAFFTSCPCQDERCFLINPCFLHFQSGENEAWGGHIPSPSAPKTGIGEENYSQPLHFTIFHSSNLWFSCVLSLFNAPGIVLGSDKQAIQKGKWANYTLGNFKVMLQKNVWQDSKRDKNNHIWSSLKSSHQNLAIDLSVEEQLGIFLDEWKY